MTNGEPTSQSANSYPTVLSTEGMNGGNEDVVDANVNVVNAMFAELLDAGEISPDALRSYYVDFYLTQSLGGGFAQYVFTAPEREEIDPFVREGLEGMGATRAPGPVQPNGGRLRRPVRYRRRRLPGRRHGWNAAGEDVEEDGTSEAVKRMEELDGEFESLLETEDILALNAAWLRGQDGLLVLADEELDAHIAGRVARIPNLAERQAAAAEEALLDAPEFEQIIRELCDVAGHALLKITMGDPNYEHNGETTLAWHFTTEQGEFLMVEDEDEAFMLNPRTKEIVAALEFEEADA